MTDTLHHGRAELPDPETAPELFEAILQRRAMAFGIDLVILLILSTFLFVFAVIFGILTFGLGLLALPLVLPFAILAYYTVTLGSPARATLGMRTMDLVLTPTRGPPLDGWKILVHPIVFWISCWVAWPVSLAIALFTPRREMVHDLVTGTLMVRRSPMVRHWRRARL